MNVMELRKIYEDAKNLSIDEIIQKTVESGRSTVYFSDTELSEEKIEQLRQDGLIVCQWVRSWSVSIF